MFWSQRVVTVHQLNKKAKSLRKGMSDADIVARRTDGKELMEATLPPQHFDAGSGRVLVTGNNEDVSADSVLGSPG